MRGGFRRRRARPIGAMVAALGMMLAATPAWAQESCSRAALQAAAESYVAAQTAGDPGKIALAPSVAYLEQKAPVPIASGVLSTPQKVDFHRSLLDPHSCESFTELIITDPAHPYVLGTRLKLAGGRVSEIETLVTDADDWLFKASNTLKYSRAETWDVIPPAQRDSRATIVAAANAYLDKFNDESVVVPWGKPCARLEGGIYTAKGAPGVVSPEDTCDVGVPKKTPLVDRRYIVDEDLGSVVVLLTFGNSKLPDSHMFRIEHGRIRYVHTITVCKTLNCGFPPHKFADTAE